MSFQSARNESETAMLVDRPKRTLINQSSSAVRHVERTSASLLLPRRYCASKVVFATAKVKPGLLIAMVCSQFRFWGIVEEFTLGLAIIIVKVSEIRSPLAVIPAHVVPDTCGTYMQPVPLADSHENVTFAG